MLPLLPQGHAGRAREPSGRGLVPACIELHEDVSKIVGRIGPAMRRLMAGQFNTRLASGLSSEKVGTSISNFSPLSLTI
jgi:hypothetical protein